MPACELHDPLVLAITQFAPMSADANATTTKRPQERSATRRSLLGFAKLMEKFEEHRVSFVSVTQHFHWASVRVV